MKIRDSIIRPRGISVFLMILSIIIVHCSLFIIHYSDWTESTLRALSEKYNGCKAKKTNNQRRGGVFGSEKAAAEQAGSQIEAQHLCTTVPLFSLLYSYFLHCYHFSIAHSL